jgi:hypothetical protein
MCADVPLRPWYFGRNTVRDRHGVSLSDLVCLSAPTLDIWYGSVSSFGL